MKQEHPLFSLVTPCSLPTKWVEKRMFRSCWFICTRKIRIIYSQMWMSNSRSVPIVETCVQEEAIRINYTLTFCTCMHAHIQEFLFFQVMRFAYILEAIQRGSQSSAFSSLLPLGPLLFFNFPLSPKGNNILSQFLLELQKGLIRLTLYVPIQC